MLNWREESVRAIHVLICVENWKLESNNSKVNASEHTGKQLFGERYCQHKCLRPAMHIRTIITPIIIGLKKKILVFSKK